MEATCVVPKSSINKQCEMKASCNMASAAQQDDPINMATASVSTVILSVFVALCSTLVII